jgi:hypothetical protein
MMLARTVLFLGAFAFCLGAHAQQAEETGGKGEKVVAYFYANTGGDVMDGPAGPYKLELHLEYADPDSGEPVHIKQVIAQCGRISGGNVFGGDGVREIDVALCEGDPRYAGIERYAGIDARYEGAYWLISEPGELTVRKGWLDSPQEIIVTYRIPHTRAIGKMEF